MKSFVLALLGLPITIPILIYLGFCAAMSKITGEMDRAKPRKTR